MAGPGKATWVKVKGKGGRMTTRAIGMTKGGGSYEQGQVITQSEFNEARKKTSEARTSKKKEKTAQSKSDAQFKESNLFQYKDGTEIELSYNKRTVLDNQQGNNGYRELDAYTLAIKSKGGRKFNSLSVETRSREAIDGFIKGLESEHGKIVAADKFENVYQVVRSKNGRMLKTSRLERKGDPTPFEGSKK